MGLIFEIFLAWRGFLLGAAAKERSDARAARNPGRESLRRVLTRVAGIAFVVWLLGFHGLHMIETTLSGR